MNYQKIIGPRQFNGRSLEKEMKVCNLRLEQVVVGLKIRGLVPPYRIGTVTHIDHKDDDYAWILWEGEDKEHSGFYGNDCKCEVVECPSQKEE